MASELRQKVDRVYLAALQASAQERAALLDGCEPEVRAAVEALLARVSTGLLPEVTAPAAPAAADRAESKADMETVTLPARPHGALKSGDELGKRFRIVRVVGKGGMGEVYQAEDRDLGGVVALKTLRHDLAGRPEFLQRFRREVQLARQVTHPNVCRVFDVGYDTVNGNPLVFLTMEFLSGETLSHRLRRTGPMDEAVARPLLENLLAGLDALHSQGIVHRDFKPGNVIVVPSGSGGEKAVITDFGLARAHELERGEPLTEANLVLGTPLYMAPEQLQGEPATPQSDIYALGLVMYETLTGKRPFAHESFDPAAPGLTAALGRLGKSISAPMSATIKQCLAPNRADRPQSVAEVLQLLRGGRPHRQPASVTPWRGAIAGALLALLLAAGVWLGFFRKPGTSGAPLPDKKLVAVLPFQAVNEDRELRAVSDGIAEVLTSQLSQLEQFQESFAVVPASEIRSRKIESASQAHKEYGVNIAVTGSIQRQGNSLLFTANVVDAAQMRQIHATTFDIGIKDLKALREGVTRQVLGMLDVRPTTRAESALGLKETDRADAYFAYLEGRGYLHRFDVAGNIDRAIASLEKALQADPNYVLAHAAVGEAYWRKALGMNDKVWADRALVSARKAVELGGTLALPHVKLGEIYGQSGKPREAIQEFKLALASQPANADAYRGLGRTYASIGLNQEAEDAYRQAVRLRPTDWYAHNLLGVFYYGVGKYVQAEQAWIKARELTPDNEYPYRNLGMTYVAMGNFDAASEHFKKSNAIKPSFLARLGLARLWYFAGKQTEAVAEYNAAIKIEPNNHLAWGGLGDAYIQIPGQTQPAKEAYAKAIESCERRLALAPNDEEIVAYLASYHAKSGQKAKALEVLSRLSDAGSLRLNTRFEIAVTHEAAGERRLAIQEFQRLLTDQRSATQIRSDPALRQLSQDPAFLKLLTR